MKHTNDPGAALYGLLAPYASFSIIGMCKNAGKTTVLNRFIAQANAHDTPLGLTSIGRDGEDTDLVTGTGKPGIRVKAGTLLATASGLLALCDITREILDTTGISTPLGEVVLVRALSDGAVQIAGPSMVDQLARVAQSLRSHGAGQVVIDGAISRKSLCSRRLSEATVLCTGASCGASMEAVLRETAFFCQLAGLPEVADETLLALVGCTEAQSKALLVGKQAVPLLGGGLGAALRDHAANENRFLFIEGALTDALLRPLVTSGPGLAGLTLVVRDASRLLVTRGMVHKLQARHGALAVLDSVNLRAVTVNPFSAFGNHFPPGEFLERMQALVPVPVLNVEEKEVPA